MTPERLVFPVVTDRPALREITCLVHDGLRLPREGADLLRDGVGRAALVAHLAASIDALKPIRCVAPRRFADVNDKAR